DTSRQTKNLNKLLIRILLHLQVEFSNNLGIGEGRCQNKKDNPEKLQIVIITRKRIVSSSVWSNDTTLSLVF
ncbi:hypothetical protein, partial [Phocaeicola vulgatus]|uniref:hypothetical protein n=1 Tax=Phocaeicola vulgatus TaxID=821 RepID=UPI0039B6C6E7